MDEKKLDRLYDLLDRIEAEGDADTAAALREAILKIEYFVKYENQDDL